ncbi:MAG: hypothetical protein RIT04_187 [Candidatus Parcubacteria bacterium]|jgi:hypothetical protein
MKKLALAAFSLFCLSVGCSEEVDDCVYPYCFKHEFYIRDYFIARGYPTRISFDEFKGGGDSVSLGSLKVDVKKDYVLGSFDPMARKGDHEDVVNNMRATRYEVGRAYIRGDATIGYEFSKKIQLDAKIDGVNSVNINLNFKF